MDGQHAGYSQPQGLFRHRSFILRAFPLPKGSETRPEEPGATCLPTWGWKKEPARRSWRCFRSQFACQSFHLLARGLALIPEGSLVVGQVCALKELVSGGGCMKKASGPGQCGGSLRAGELRQSCFQPQGPRKKAIFCQGLYSANKGVKSTSEVPSRVPSCSLSPKSA